MRDLKHVITETILKSQLESGQLDEGRVARVLKKLGALAAAAAVGAGAVIGAGSGGSAERDKEYVTRDDGSVAGYRDRSIKSKKQRKDDTAHWDRESGEVTGWSNDRIR